MIDSVAVPAISTKGKSMSTSPTTEPIQLSEYFGAPPMPELWVEGADSGSPIVYDDAEDRDRGLFRWPTGQHIRLMYPSRCTVCRRARKTAPELMGLVSVLQLRRNTGRGPTEWICYCPDHYAKR